jgi:hypothetical protein
MNRQDLSDAPAADVLARLPEQPIGLDTRFRLRPGRQGVSPVVQRLVFVGLDL